MLLFLFALAGGAVYAETSDRDLFGEIRSLPNDLARYAYLAKVTPRLSAPDQQMAWQLLASAEDELGLYAAALRDFPFNRDWHPAMAWPKAAEWRTADAAGEIAKLAARRRIVLVNEAHHDAHTRELTLALLPRLRALGFTHFAAEALDERDAAWMKRGYPAAASGSEYLHEPLYGEIVREALRLGFVVVPYESGDAGKDREYGQAEHLYRRVFAADPKARLFVHAGYGHIDKTVGAFGNGIEPMAMRLRELSGFDPLSVNQTEWRSHGPSHPTGTYQSLVAAFHPDRPTVLVHRRSGKLWSSDPRQQDVSVLLPPEHGAPRPDWLTLGETRQAFMIDSELCAASLPCVVEAHYAGEPDQAIAADRYTFLRPHQHAPLYLRPGRYRLRVWDAAGRTLHENTIQIDRHPA